MFRSVEVADPMRAKQLRTGLMQLGEEGAIQVFRPQIGGTLLLGAIGVLQFEVVAHRLQHEYGVAARYLQTRHTMARWVTAADPRELNRFIEAYSQRIYYDAVEEPTILVSSSAEIKVAQENWPGIRFHALREHAGLVGHTPATA